MSVRLSDYLNPDAVLINLGGHDKEDVLKELAAPLLFDLDDAMAQTAIDVLIERESLGSTGTGDGVAIPHGKVEGFPGTRIAFGRHPHGVDFDAVDGAPVHLLFLVLAPTDAAGAHLRLLAKIARLARNNELRQGLISAEDKDAVLRILGEADERDET